MLGLVTIGQSPRNDVVASMFGDSPPACMLQAGALDDLSYEHIHELAPLPAEQVLVTRLRSGQEVVVAKERIIAHMRRAVQRLEASGVSVICVLCTGSFPQLGSSRRVLFPDRIVTAVVDSVVQSGVLGVLMPHNDQADAMRSKWCRVDRDVALATVSPYSRPDSLEHAIGSLNEAGVDAMVMDCMGYDRGMQVQVRELTDVPVLLANGVVSAVLREAVGL